MVPTPPCAVPPHAATIPHAITASPVRTVALMPIVTRSPCLRFRTTADRPEALAELGVRAHLEAEHVAVERERAILIAHREVHSAHAGGCAVRFRGRSSS